MSNSVFYERVLKLCTEKGISPTALAEAIGKGSATVSGWKKGAKPRAETIRAVADFFGVDPSFLTGDSPVATGRIHTNNGAIGHFHAPVTISNGSERQLSANEIEILRVFSSLGTVDQAKVIVYANELKENSKK